MWLINTSSLRLEHIVSPESRHYAILSHTWDEGQEVTFQDMANLNAQRRKKGFKKIKRTCRIARSRGLKYAWIDTCCINKENNTELAEAINSMFAWYKKSTVCFAFLSDLRSWHGDIKRRLKRCRWFSRGWTLQELLAPNVVEFYDWQWVLRGDKTSLHKEIALVTGIDDSVLLNRHLLPTMPVAKRMSWAAHRQTSRQEDMAYCLLGIFDVHMSLIYGEGGNAFTRLQERIIESSNDLSVFAWNSDDTGPEKQAYRGILARSPYEFRLCQTLETAEDYTVAGHEFILANNKLRFQICLRKTTDQYYIDLATKRITSKGATTWFVVYLAKTPSGFVRPRCGMRFLGDNHNNSVKQSTVYIAKDVSPEGSRSLEQLLEKPFEIIFDLPAHIQLAAIKAQPSRLWDPQKKSFFIIESGQAYWVFVSIVINNSTTGSSTKLALVCELCVGPETEDVLVWATICSKGDLLDRVNKYTDAEDATIGLSRTLQSLCSELSSGSSSKQRQIRLGGSQVLLEPLPRGIKVSYRADTAYKKDNYTGPAISVSRIGPVQYASYRPLTPSHHPPLQSRRLQPTTLIDLPSTTGMSTNEPSAKNDTSNKCSR